ncbi:hypothetical protein Q5P01_016846 [Channa striata]|uniref:Uncharacterized protein n=1 Tax=Channa striata TaxID=64152 RepID=A0AA88SGL8_CHASR|nr:hypothetical protein Q5P01_016846 [Channa striata]
MMSVGHQLQTVRCGRHGDTTSGAVIQRIPPAQTQRPLRILSSEPPTEHRGPRQIWHLFKPGRRRQDQDQDHLVKRGTVDFLPNH